MAPPLGRLVSVPLREVWAHEANDFTPWLADGENLALLADTPQLGQLQLQGTEVAVGNFSIDIRAIPKLPKTTLALSGGNGGVHERR
jgi:hypothetical protein